ncbi:MAG: hypothetical protein AAB281_04000, partial [Actinomycetota bacterium]
AAASFLPLDTGILLNDDGTDNVSLFMCVVISSAFLSPVPAPAAVRRPITVLTRKPPPGDVIKNGTAL